MSLGNTALIEMMCDVCELEKATVMCGDCAGSYCDDCDGDVHQGSKATHKRESLGSQKKVNVFSYSQQHLNAFGRIQARMKTR